MPIIRLISLFLLFISQSFADESSYKCHYTDTRYTKSIKKLGISEPLDYNYIPRIFFCETDQNDSCYMTNAIYREFSDNQEANAQLALLLNAFIAGNKIQFWCRNGYATNIAMVIE